MLNVHYISIKLEKSHLPKEPYPGILKNKVLWSLSFTCSFHNSTYLSKTNLFVYLLTCLLHLHVIHHKTEVDPSYSQLRLSTYNSAWDSRHSIRVCGVNAFMSEWVMISSTASLSSDPSKRKLLLINPYWVRDLQTTCPQEPRVSDKLDKWIPDTSWKRQIL